MDVNFGKVELVLILFPIQNVVWMFDFKFMYFLVQDLDEVQSYILVQRSQEQRLVTLDSIIHQSIHVVSYFSYFSMLSVILVYMFF